MSTFAVIDGSALAGGGLMPLVDMGDMLRHAHRHGYAVGAFDVVDLDFISGVMAAAERAHAPVILSVAESHFELFDVELLLPAMEAAARRASVPVAIHLDHGASLESAARGIRLGCNGVMIDASHRPFEENVARTRDVVAMAHGCGVTVEGELGYVPGIEGADAERHPGTIAYTAPEEARAYVERTGVDCLAVSIGTVHGRMKGRPDLDIPRLARINQALGIPLVIHGGTGLSDEQFRALIANGVAKINYYTALAQAAAGRLRANAQDERLGDSDLRQGVAAAVAAEAERCLRLWGAAGQAAAALTACARWRPVEHVILFNADLDDKDAEAMMAEGRRVLGAIPGVRAIATGTATRTEARFRHCWLVRFCHPAVIDSYRDHPDHVAFADRRFRPHAGDRVSIDYHLTLDGGD